MAYVLYVDVEPEEDDEKVRQQFAFFGKTEKECEEQRDALAARCGWFKAQIDTDSTAESLAEISDEDWPIFNADDEEEDEEDEEQEEER